MNINFKEGMTVPVTVYNEDQLQRLLGFIMSAGLKPVEIEEKPKQKVEIKTSLFEDDIAPKKTKTIYPNQILAQNIVSMFLKLYPLENSTNENISKTIGRAPNWISVNRNRKSSKIHVSNVRNFAKKLGCDWNELAEGIPEKCLI